MRLPQEIVALTSAALGQVLAADILADLDSPPFTKALMDGYAVQAADLMQGPIELNILEEVQAGAMPMKSIGPGDAIGVYTGAPVPVGTDAVVMKERCEVLPNGKVRVHDTSLRPGKSVLDRGAEMRSGETVLRQGTVISPNAFGLFASVGKTAVPAYPRAKVGVLATGDELVEANMKPKDAQIRNSNGPMLVAQSVRAGALPRYLGIARDDETTLKSMIREGLTTTNILVLAGGVSAGKFDLVPSVLESLGVTIRFHKVRMKPGKPMLFGTKGDVLVFGLPGNPVSANVGFELFVRPAIRKLSGHAEPGTMMRKMPLNQPLMANNDRPTYQPARLQHDAVQPLPWLGSADLRALLNADALIALPVGTIDLAAGAMVDVIPMG